MTIKKKTTLKGKGRKRKFNIFKGKSRSSWQEIKYNIGKEMMWLVQMEGEREGSRESDSGRKPFCLCKWGGKQRHRRSSRPPGSCKSFLLLAPPPPRRLPLHTCSWHPCSPWLLWAGRRWEEEETADSGEQGEFAKGSTSRRSWQWKVSAPD